MTDKKFPPKIYAHPDGEWFPMKVGDQMKEYISANLYNALKKDRDRYREAMGKVYDICEGNE